MLKARRDVPDSPRDLRIYRVTGTARRCRVVCLVKDQKGLWCKFPQPVTQPRRIGLVDKQAMGHQKSGVGRPGICGGHATFASHTRNVGPVQDSEYKAKARFHLVTAIGQAWTADTQLQSGRLSGAAAVLAQLSQPL